MNTHKNNYRLAVGVAIAAALILVWLSLGVGIIGRDGDPANLMYFGVLAIGIIGALVARFRAGGMAHALIAMALAQMTVALIALIGGLGYRLDTSRRADTDKDIKTRRRSHRCINYYRY